ncbi:MAG: hypothetical protein V4592_15115 [Bacteroidota bacterium]
MTAIELLNHVLELFELHKGNSKMLNYLLKHKMIHSSFEQRYILNNIDFPFTVTNTVYKNDNEVEFYLDALDGCPYKAEMIFDGKWYLKSFRFLCQGCFGEDSECGVCGGSGWGVL